MNPTEIKFSPINRAVGCTIKVLRKEAGILQEALAEKLGIAQSQISRIELGTADIHLSTIDTFGQMVGFKGSEITQIGEELLEEASKHPLKSPAKWPSVTKSMGEVFKKWDIAPDEKTIFSLVESLGKQASRVMSK